LPDTAHFWSGRTGGVGGEDIAISIATGNDGVTLEMLQEGQIDMPDYNPADPASVKMWEDLSESYARQAVGVVRAVVGVDLRPGNVWEAKELPALLANPMVSEIIKIDPHTGSQTTIFRR
jgi:hypothetical protein